MYILKSHLTSFYLLFSEFNIFLLKIIADKKKTSPIFVCFSISSNNFLHFSFSALPLFSYIYEIVLNLLSSSLV